MKKYYLINYTAADASWGGDIKKQEAELEKTLKKNFPNAQKLGKIQNTWLISDMDVTSGDVWLQAYTEGLNLNVMKVSETRAANLR